MLLSESSVVLSLCVSNRIIVAITNHCSLVFFAIRLFKGTAALRAQWQLLHVRVPVAQQSSSSSQGSIPRGALQIFGVCAAAAGGCQPCVPNPAFPGISSLLQLVKVQINPSKG